MRQAEDGTVLRALLLAALLAGLAAPALRAEPESDKALAQRVMRALEKEDRMQAATLWGTALTQDERQRASRAAYRVNGVKKVDNRLAIAGGS
jgi:hypothetical protein